MILTKMFIKQLKLSLVEDKDDAFDKILEEKEPDVVKDSLYRFVGHQSKVCIRKSLGIVKQLYAKFSDN